MIVADMGEIALTLLVCWLCGILLLVLMMLTCPILLRRFKSRAKPACYGEIMSQEESSSFRAWLLHPILARIDHMAKTLADLNLSIAANTSATNNAVAAFAAGSSGDFTAQTTAIDANTAKLAAITPGGGVTPPAGPITASPATVVLSASVPSQVVTLTDTTTPNTFSATSSNTAIVTVSPASGPGPFTISRIGAGTGASVAFTDQQNNVLTVPVSAS